MRKRGLTEGKEGKKDERENEAQIGREREKKKKS